MKVLRHKGIRNFLVKPRLVLWLLFFFLRKKKLSACFVVFDASVKKLIGGQHNPTVIFFAYCISVSGDAYLNVNFMHAKIE